jgi:hypothetical protein
MNILLLVIKILSFQLTHQLVFVVRHVSDYRRKINHRYSNNIFDANLCRTINKKCMYTTTKVRLMIGKQWTKDQCTFFYHMMCICRYMYVRLSICKPMFIQRESEEQQKFVY